MTAAHLVAGGRFQVWRGGTPLLPEPSWTPFFAAGADPGLAMRDTGTDMTALRMPLGRAAGLTVEESDRGDLQIRPYPPPPESLASLRRRVPGGMMPSPDGKGWAAIQTAPRASSCIGRARHDPGRSPAPDRCRPWVARPGPP